jgi:hypothetical protein
MYVVLPLVTSKVQTTGCFSSFIFPCLPPSPTPLQDFSHSHQQLLLSHSYHLLRHPLHYPITLPPSYHLHITPSAALTHTLPFLTPPPSLLPPLTHILPSYHVSVTSSTSSTTPSHNPPPITSPSLRTTLPHILLLPSPPSQPFPMLPHTCLLQSPLPCHSCHSQPTHTPLGVLPPSIHMCEYSNRWSFLFSQTVFPTPRLRQCLASLFASEVGTFAPVFATRLLTLLSQ